MTTGGFDSKWLPGSPHREAILEYLADGRAHVVERGHWLPPLLVFEDGGAVDLPLVRLKETERGKELVRDSVPQSPDQTKHRDVCGSLSEFRARITEDPARAAAEKAELERLMEDVWHMLGRLEKRREAYDVFRCGLKDVCERMDAIECCDSGAGFSELEQVVTKLRSVTAESIVAETGPLLALTDAIRDTANRHEKSLREFRDLAVRVNDLYGDVKGGRRWEKTPPSLSGA